MRGPFPGKKLAGPQAKGGGIDEENAGDVYGAASCASNGPSYVFADAAVTFREAEGVITVSFGGEEYLFAYGSTMETLPEAEERDRQVFAGW